VEPLLSRDNDKHTVLALREIAKGLISNATVAPQPEEDVEISLEQALAEELAAEAKSEQ
jgi:hypothetical protein